MSDTFDRVKTLMAKEFQIEPERITPDTQLSELGVDSLAALEFVFILEDAFKVAMDAATDLRGGLVRNVVDAVDVAMTRKQSGTVSLA